MPRWSRHTKYFWFTRAVSWITSGGTSRNAGSKRPSSGTGHSVSPGILEQQPLVLDQRQPRLLRRQLGPHRDDRAPLATVDDHVRVAELLDVARRAAPAGSRPNGGSGGRRWSRRSRFPPPRTPPISRRTSRRSPAAGAPSAGSRSRPMLRPSASTWATGSRGSRARRRWRGSSGAGSPGRAITANSTCPPLPSSRTTSCSRVSPVERRKPSIACAGASARGPLRSSVLAVVASATPRTISASRRGVA